MTQPQPQKTNETEGMSMPTLEGQTQGTFSTDFFTSQQPQEVAVVENKNTPSVLDKLPPEKRAEVQRIVNAMDISKSEVVMQYGTSTQRDLSKFSDSVLAEVRVKDSGDAGEILSDLMMNVRKMDTKTLEMKDSILAKLPLIGYFFRRAEREMMQWENMGQYMEKVVNNLDKAKFSLTKDITKLDVMYAKNQDYFEQLNLYIAAGELKLAQFEEEHIAPLRQEAEETKDETVAMRLQDIVSLRDRFEKRLHDLKLSRTISLQMAPQIRVIQQNNQILAEKIESAVVNTIPLWKNQIVLSLALNRQKNALQAQKDVTNTTNQLLEQNSAMLKNSSIEIATENEKGVVAIESLKIAQQNLLETLDETLRIQTEGKQKRREAEQQLVLMEEELKAKVLKIASAESDAKRNATLGY